MTSPAIAETAEFYRVDASLKLDADKRSLLGQFMTPASIARFMASLFTDTRGQIRVLDPGAGVGSLTAAFAERLCTTRDKPDSVEFICYEVDAVLSEYLEKTLHDLKIDCNNSQIDVRYSRLEDDFILTHRIFSQPEIFDDSGYTSNIFTHAILNPPYRKIDSLSGHRRALRKAGVETSNLYTGFMFLAAQRLKPGGELVAIIPRSFCNGPYFKPFREEFFSMMHLRHIHIFEKRDLAFKDDAVLQENIIIHAVKGGEHSDVTITTSRGTSFEKGPEDHTYSAEDMTRHQVPHHSVIRPDDHDHFVHIPTNELEQAIVDRMSHFTATLDDIPINVSTGPVVDFRLKEDLQVAPVEGAVPLLYAAHFQGGTLTWPKTMRKPNAILLSDTSRKWLWPNQGHYVVTRRFTSKEERRRVVASLYASDLPGELVGFENHLNVFHVNQNGMSRALAVGLSLFLNCSLVDRYFRQFNGHTQVNATDLRSLRYPNRVALERIGAAYDGDDLSQQEIDKIIEEEISHMADDDNPLLAQQKIDEALAILKALGMPRQQQNERSALTLLALLDLKPSDMWSQIKRPLIGITPIMDYIRDHYGREYAPNTRETIRRQTMHQYVDAGIARYNPDDPDRPVNSPHACYQISDESFQVILNYGTEDWQPSLEKYLDEIGSLADKWAMHRQIEMVPVKLSSGMEIKLTPGSHSELIKEIIDEFAPRFSPGAEVIYVGDTGEKVGYFERDRLIDLGVKINLHGKIPDVVLYSKTNNWLLLIESVTSHGPMDAKRHHELAQLFSDAKPGLVFVTAFPDRATMGKYLGVISWETEVWCADAPTHLIHFDGKRFLGPYKSDKQ